MERFSLSRDPDAVHPGHPAAPADPVRPDRAGVASATGSTREIDELTRILDSDAELRKLVSAELAAVAKKFGTERRTVLLESAGAPVAAVPLEVADDPCRVLLSSTGLLARTANGEPLAADEDGKRTKHDVIVSAVPATARGEVGAVTSHRAAAAADGDRPAAAAGHRGGAQPVGRRPALGVPVAGGRTRRWSA